MVNQFDREAYLRERLNGFLAEGLCLPPDDYYSNLKAEHFLSLKSVLGDINNIFTLKVTHAFTDWITSALNLSSSVKEDITQSVLNTKPSTNGYDIEISEPIKIIAEVKCNIPINGGSVYGSAQKNGIQKDINALMCGKSKSSINPEQYLKFMVFLDLPEIRKATEHFIKNLKKYKEDISFIDDSSNVYTPDKIYVVFVSI